MTAERDPTERLVDTGYVTAHFLGTREWIDTRHGTLPDSLFHQGGLLSVLGVVLVAAIAIGFILRVRTLVGGDGGSLNV